MVGLYGLTAVQLSEDVDARLIVDVACRRGQGLGSILEERGALRPGAHHGGTERFGHGSCSWHGASQHPGSARGVSKERHLHSGVGCAPELLHFGGFQISVPSVMK